MPDGIHILKMRILISLLRMSPESCTVTNLSQTLAEEKYAVSRAMAALEKDGLVVRASSRLACLTQQGEQTAHRFADRMDIATNHFIYEGVSEEKAHADAIFFTLYCSDETFGVIQGMEERYRMKTLFQDRTSFSGAMLCKQLRDGSYPLPFIIYRERVKNGSNISMANEGLHHPCTLMVAHGIGTVSIKARSVSQHSAVNGQRMQGKVHRLKYYNGSEFCDAEQSGDMIRFPADVLHFVGIGTQAERILHGSVCMKMTCTVGVLHMPESTAIFTILI